MRQKICMLALTMMLVASAYGVGHAADAVGVWRSTTGNVFIIPYSTTSFEISIKTADGRRLRGHGQWYTNEIGRRFRYFVDGFPGKFNVCTFQRSNPNAMRCEGADGVTQYWIRVR